MFQCRNDKEKTMILHQSNSFVTASAVCVAVTSLTLLFVPPVQAQAGKTKKPPKISAQKPKQKPGGANQVTGLNGKIGDMLFDGRWRFQVQEVKEVPTYTLTVPSSQQDYGRFNSVAHEDPTTSVFSPKPGYALIAVKCLVKNGQNKVEHLHCYPPDLKTALTDDQGNSYPPIVYDMYTDGAWTTKALLPGSGQSMTVLFAVPPDTKLKDLVFSLKNYSDRKVSNLRISLGAPVKPTDATPSP
jgi:hypothetical protein